MMSPPSPDIGPPPDLHLLLEHLMGVLLLQSDLFPDDLRAALLGSSWDHHPTQALEQNAPLYKYLARALLETPVPLFGSVFELLNTFKELMLRVKFRLHVQEPFFSLLKGKCIWPKKKQPAT